MKRKTGIFVPATLGMLTAFGPFVTDFYLPVLPEMTEFFRTSPALVSMSLTASMVGLAAGQILIGPLTDKFGRKHILVASMLLFAVASVLCILSTDIHVFNAMRVFQGLAGAGGIVISKSIATDMFSGKDLAGFMALLGGINGIAPVLAPVLGGSVAGFASWQGVFCLLLAVGVILMVCSMCLKESLPVERRMHKSMLSVYGNLFKVFRNPLFTLSTLSVMTSAFAFFAYIASSPFILQQVYRLSPFHFSLCFGVNALMIGIGAGLSTQFRHQSTALKCGAINMLVASVLVALCLLAHMPLILLMAAYMYVLLCFGLIQPAVTAIALDCERDNAGAASAIFGASIFLAGGLSSPLVGIGEIKLASSVVIFAGALLCIMVTLPLCRRLRRA